MKPLWKISHGWDKTHSMVLQGAAEQLPVIPPADQGILTLLHGGLC